MSRYPQTLVSSVFPLIRDLNQHTQAMPSLILIAGYCVNSLSNSVPNALSLKNQFIHSVFPHLISSQGLHRCMSQVTCFKVLKDVLLLSETAASLDEDEEVDVHGKH